MSSQHDVLNHTKFSCLQTVRSSKDKKVHLFEKDIVFFNETLVAEKVHLPNFSHPVILFVCMHDGFVGTVVPKSFCTALLFR